MNNDENIHVTSMANLLSRREILIGVGGVLAGTVIGLKGETDKEKKEIESGKNPSNALLQMTRIAISGLLGYVIGRVTVGIVSTDQNSEKLS